MQRGKATSKMEQRGITKAKIYLSSRNKVQERNPLVSSSRLALRLICTQDRGKKENPWNQKNAMTERYLHPGFACVCVCQLNVISYVRISPTETGTHSGSTLAKGKQSLGNNDTKTITLALTQITDIKRVPC